MRAVVCDDPAQATVAAAALTEAELIAVALPCLCEFVWVLLRVYGFQPTDAASAIRVLLATANVEVNRPAVEAGLLELKQAETLPMASLPMKAAGSEGKPSFPSMRRQWHCSPLKDYQDIFYDKHVTSMPMAKVARA